MKLALLSSTTQKTTLELLIESCKNRGINYEVMNPQNTTPFLKLNDGDALYRITDVSSYGFAELEYQLVTSRIATFYKNNESLFINREENDSLILFNKNIAVPKTANFIPKDRDELRNVVSMLGGFPLVIKSLGGSHGVGVMRVDSFASLFSVADYLIKQGGRYVIKEYINTTSTARLIVLGDTVIDSIEYRANKDDFRSNEGKKPNVYRASFDNDVNDLAVKAVHALGLEFGGVDVLLSDTQPLVAEVNFPCFFARCQLLTGTDISGMMVDYLVEKSKKL